MPQLCILFAARGFCNATRVTGAQISQAIGHNVGYFHACALVRLVQPLPGMDSPVSTAPTPKLIDRVRQAIRLRHYSRRTEDSYASWVRRFILFHRKRHPVDMGGAEITAFLTSLATRERVSASTQNQALSALLFLYRDVLGTDLGVIPPVVRARTPERLPVVLSRDEVSAVLGQLGGVMWIITALLYGSGLRLSECLDLRVKRETEGSGFVSKRGMKVDASETGSRLSERGFQRAEVTDPGGAASCFEDRTVKIDYLSEREVSHQARRR